MNLWIDLLKARKGERVGGSYVHRWWNNGRWNYKYSNQPHKHHGIAHTAKEEHSVKVPPMRTGKSTPSAENAFHYARQRALAEGTTHTAIYHGVDGKPLFKVTVRPGQARPILITPAGKKVVARNARRVESFEALEGWHKRTSSKVTIHDAFGEPWFDVRKQAGEQRMSVRWAPGPFSRRPGEEAEVGWTHAPVAGDAKELETWVKDQHKRQRESHRVHRSRPAKKFPKDERRPATTALEHGQVRWTAKQVPLLKKRGVRWIRTAVFRSEKDQRAFLGHVMGEHFGVIINTAHRQLILYNLAQRGMTSENMKRLLGFSAFGQRDKQTITIDPDSPTYRAVQRAVNSYDPEKGWRFNTWIGECLWWEYFKETKGVLDEIKRRRREITTTSRGDPVGDIFDKIDLDQDAAPGHEEIIGAGAHYQQADVAMSRNQEALGDWKVRQEDRLARHISENEDANPAAAITALHEMRTLTNLEQARSFVVRHQSEGGHGFAEPIEIEAPQPKPSAKLTKKEKSQWVMFLGGHPGLTPSQRIALLTIAPTGDLNKIRPFDEVADELHAKHKREFPTRPTVGHVVDLFLNAHQNLAGHPEFEAMQQKLSLSPIEKAIGLLRGLSAQRIFDSLYILRKGKKGEKARTYKYHRREGAPGHYKYWYKDHAGNHIQATNAPGGHGHHEKNLGDPQMHSSEPDPDQNPEFFDQKGRKMNRSVPGHAEWNQDHSTGHPLQSWAARWRQDQNNEGSDLEHAYYDSDVRERDELKFNVDNRHFDEQLPKVRAFYKEMMASKQLPSRALGLMVALLDQAQMRAGRKVHEKKKGTVGLCTLRVGNLKAKGNQATFSYGGKLGVTQKKTVILDPASMAILQELASLPGKGKNDYLFSVPVKQGDKVIFREIGYNKLRRNLAALGVTPKQFRTYHGTEIFSQAFQRLVQGLKGRPTPAALKKVTEAAALESAKALGHYLGKGKDRKAHASTALRSYIDPTVVRSLMINAMDPNSMDKAFRLQGRTEFQGLPISIENKKGSVRKWYDPHGKEGGETKMNYDYGYIRRTKGTDGDHVDVYLGPNPNADTAFVVHQMKKPDFKKYDEDKVMLGFDSEEEAKAAYLKQYNDPGFFGKMSKMSMDEFSEKVLDKENHGKMIKAMFNDPEEGDDDEAAHVVHQVTSEPPARFPHEEEFSRWLHTHPIHESEHEYEGLKQMGSFKNLHTPESDHEDADDDEANSGGSEGIELARPGEPSGTAGAEGSGDGEKLGPHPGATPEGQAVQQGGKGPLLQDQGQVRSPSPTGPNA